MQQVKLKDFFWIILEIYLKRSVMNDAAKMIRTR